MSHEWKQGKMERLTLKAVIITFSLVFLTSCSSEPSAQEKRNMFDKCVIEFIDRYSNENRYTYYNTENGKEIANKLAQELCVNHLK